MNAYALHFAFSLLRVTGVNIRDNQRLRWAFPVEWSDNLWEGPGKNNFFVQIQSACQCQRWRLAQI